MKKTNVAIVAIAVAVVIVLAAVVALYYQSPGSSAQGKLAVMGTDPAVSAYGVSDANIAYSSVYAHTAGSSMSSGWAQVSGSGSMDLMASQGTATTLATSQVAAASYDAFKFNVDSARVVYQGQTYTSTVASSTITATSQSQVQVTTAATAAAVVDLRTFIVNTGSASSPQFVFSATAEATAVPPETVASLSLTLGGTVDLSGGAWWTAFMTQTSTNVNMVGSLSSNSMSFNTHNYGNANAEVQEVIITPVSAAAQITGTLPSSFSGSAVFVVSSSGSVQQSTSLQGSALLTDGASVSSGSSTTLSYNGHIVLGSNVGGVQVTGIVSGQQYIVTMIGANTFASTTVVAS